MGESRHHSSCRASLQDPSICARCELIAQITFNFLVLQHGREMARTVFRGIAGAPLQTRRARELRRRNNVLLTLYDMAAANRWSRKKFVREFAIPLNKLGPHGEQRGARGIDAETLEHHLKVLLKERARLQRERNLPPPLVGPPRRPLKAKPRTFVSDESGAATLFLGGDGMPLLLDDYEPPDE